MTDAEIDELYERSKDDRAIIVGSEVRQIIGELRAARRESRLSRIEDAAMKQVSDIDAVRAKIAELRRLTTKEREYAEYCAGLVGATQDDDEAAAEADDKANAMEWAANALEAVLDINATLLRAAAVDPYGDAKVVSQALEAALTRAITKGEQ